MRGRPFEPGNRMGRGRPRGSQNKRTALLKALEGHGDAVVRQCLVMALRGDPTALRLCMERLIPPCKSAGPPFQMREVKSVEDLSSAFSTIFREVARGRMTAQDGQAISAALETRRRLAETEEFESRLEAVERNLTETRMSSEAKP
jgi:hypothetical protein